MCKLEKTRRVALVGAVLALVTGCFLVASTRAQESGAKDAPAVTKSVRLGVFESRAIAVAFAHSRFNTIAGKLTEEYKKAEAAGDSKRMAELRKKGEQHQQKLHRQGFGRALVDDLLEPVKDRVPAVCTAQRVDAIVAGVVHATPQVETVDVTDALVKLYEPNERALKIIEELRKHPPLPDEEIVADACKD